MYPVPALSFVHFTLASVFGSHHWERKRDRQTQTDRQRCVRERERQTDRQTDRQTETERERQRERERETRKYCSLVWQCAAPGRREITNKLSSPITASPVLWMIDDTYTTARNARLGPAPLLVRRRQQIPSSQTGWCLQLMTCMYAGTAPGKDGAEFVFLL